MGMVLWKLVRGNITREWVVVFWEIVGSLNCRILYGSMFLVGRIYGFED